MSFLNIRAHKQLESSEQGSASRFHRQPQVALLVLSLAGFGVSLYALILHIQSKLSGGEALGCDINDVLSCSNVLASEYGALFGVPLGGFGMAFFAVLLGVSLFPKLANATEKWHASLQLLVTAIGAAVSVGLAGLSYFELESVCWVCSTVHGICVLAFIVAFAGWLKSKKSSTPAESDGSAPMKFISTSLALAVPALLAGAIAPHIAPSIVGSTADAADAQLDLTKKPISETLLSVSKSRFVGKGEDYRKGNDEAPVVVHMFSDFQCPHCKSAAASIMKAQKNVGEDKVLFVYRNFPLSNKCNSSMGGPGRGYSCDLALASRCAGQQGKFWEMKDWSFGLMGASADQMKKLASRPGLKAQAATLGLNGDTFEACMKSDSELNKIRDDARVGSELGLTGTPLLVVNNRVYEGPRSPESLALLFKSLADSAE